MPDVIFRAAGESTDFVIIRSSPVLKGRARQFGSGYVQFRLLEVQTGSVPAMGSERARGVVRVIADPSPVYYGAGERSEGATILAELREECERLAAGRQV